MDAGLGVLRGECWDVPSGHCPVMGATGQEEHTSGQGAADVGGTEEGPEMAG